MQTLPCSKCGKPVSLETIRYFTADRKNIFCDAYCSFEWHQENKDNPKAGDTIEI